MDKPGIRTPQGIEEGIKSTLTVTLDPFTVLPKENKWILPISFNWYERQFQEIEKILHMHDPGTIDWKQVYVTKTATSGDYDSSWMEKVTILDLQNGCENDGDLPYFRQFGDDMIRALGTTTTQLGLDIGDGVGYSKEIFENRIRWYAEEVPEGMPAVKRLFVEGHLQSGLEIDFDKTSIWDLDYLCFETCFADKLVHYLICKCKSITELSITETQAFHYMEDCAALKSIKTLCLRNVNRNGSWLIEDDEQDASRKNIFKFMPQLKELVIDDITNTPKGTLEIFVKTAVASCKELSTLFFPGNTFYYGSDETVFDPIPSIALVHVEITSIAAFPPKVIQHFPNSSTITIHCKKVPSIEEWTERVEKGWDHSAFPKLALVEHYDQDTLNTAFPLTS